MKALIFAAGFGTRLMPYTGYKPKPLFTIGGRPVIELTIEKLIHAGCTAIVINTHHLNSCIEEFLKTRNYKIPVTTRFEPEILDTGGAIKNIADLLDNAPFLAVNGDIVTDIDYGRVYDHHLENNTLATLVLHDCERFNNVAVDTGGWITGLRVTQAPPKAPPLLAFTGIQVINPEITEHIPEKRACGIIDIYKDLMAKGKRIKAFIAEKPYWVDMGTPEKYLAASMDKMVPEAFSNAFRRAPEQPVEISRLKGDGSDRKWYRIFSGHRSMILGDHGIRNTSRVSEADSFLLIGKHLEKKGLPVPQIYHHDTFSGLIFMEDLGDENLENTVKKAGAESRATLALYKRVAELLKELSTKGGKGFDLSWTWQSPCYDRQLILEKECGYFLTAFLNGYLDMAVEDNAFDDEFSHIAGGALSGAVTGFMHRDFQSRNIMIKNGRPAIIDFQGGRRGPVQYDLASLLIDPYVSLPDHLQEEVLNHFLTLMPAMPEREKERFLACYRWCRITRNLQILGAFSFLSKVRGKGGFEEHIPTALESLRKNLNCPEASVLPKLKKSVEKIRGMG